MMAHALFRQIHVPVRNGLENRVVLAEAMVAEIRGQPVDPEAPPGNGAAHRVERVEDRQEDAVVGGLGDRPLKVVFFPWMKASTSASASSATVPI